VDDDSKSQEFRRQYTAVEFARLSPSMKVTVLIIRRAQLSSRKVIATIAEQKRRRSDW